ncbi:MAG: pilus assembly protein PilX [Gammaproteobacteria bacterium]|nr:pilus assembly protein PilX [Gammaproteobacteria bacterium]
MQGSGSATVHGEKGAVLIVSLVILLVLTIIGISGAQRSVMEERMAGNYRDRLVAFQATETALRYGELEVAQASTYTTLLFDGSDGSYDITGTTGGKDPYTDANYARTVSTLTINGAAAPPVYFIEKLPKVPLPKSSIVVTSKPKDIQYYRVTAKGTGVSGKAAVILQSVYHR